MKNIKEKQIKACNLLCVLLLAVMLVTQFTPFWELDGQTTSISSYVWLPSDHADLTAHFEQSVGSDYTINTMVLPSVFQLILPVLGIILFFNNREGIFTSIISMCAGAAGIWTYLCKPAFRLGAWQVPFAVSIILLAASIIAIIMYSKQSKDN